MLASALPGYANYMQRVRTRIVPGLWRERVNEPLCFILTQSDGSSCDLLLELASQRASSADHGNGRNRSSPPFPISPSTGKSAESGRRRGGGYHHGAAASIARRYVCDRRLIEGSIDYEGAISNSRRLH
jgi:hypothetical protein